MSTGTALELAPPTLAELAATANREHGYAVATAVAAVEHALLAGEALLEAKKLIGHGKWQDWLVENVHASISGVCAYMRLARHADLVRSEQPTTIEAARRLLTGQGDSRLDGARVDEAKALRRGGATYGEIAEQVGASPATVYRWLNPKVAERQRRKASQQSMAGRRALNAKRDAAAVARRGGSVAHAYEHVIKAREALDRAIANETDRDAKRCMQTALARLYEGSDFIVKAVGTSAPRVAAA